MTCCQLLLHQPSQFWCDTRLYPYLSWFLYLQCLFRECIHSREIYKLKTMAFYISNSSPFLNCKLRCLTTYRTSPLGCLIGILVITLVKQKYPLPPTHPLYLLYHKFCYLNKYPYHITCCIAKYLGFRRELVSLFSSHSFISFFSKMCLESIYWSQISQLKLSSSLHHLLPILPQWPPASTCVLPSHNSSFRVIILKYKSDEVTSL